MTRLLGIDLGARRIGLAVADTATGTVRRLATLQRGSLVRDARALSTVTREQRIDEFVVGLPLNADGSEGAQAVASRTWATQIAAQLGLPVRWRDERWTSEQAEKMLGRMGRGRSGGPPSPAARRNYRATVDQQAAALILETELAESAEGGR